MQTIKWGIIGLGYVANKFMKAEVKCEGCEVIACASHSKDKALNFSQKYNIKYYYDNYEDLVSNPEIDIVYIGNTHNFHYECVKLCLEHGKNVLCEKAFTENSAQAAKLIALARKKNLFLMEAMWTRFLPAVEWAKEQIECGNIGAINHIEVNLGHPFDYSPEARLFNPKLAGGGLLDMGIYPLSFICMFLGNNPSSMASICTKAPTGVDNQGSVSMLYPDGKTASFSYSALCRYKNAAYIYGTKGYLTIPDFKNAQSAKLTTDDNLVMEFSKPHECGFVYEIDHVNSLLRSSRKESTIMPLEDTKEILALCDKLRSTWGIAYPDEV